MLVPLFVVTHEYPHGGQYQNANFRSQSPLQRIDTPRYLVVPRNLLVSKLICRRAIRKFLSFLMVVIWAWATQQGRTSPAHPGGSPSISDHESLQAVLASDILVADPSKVSLLISMPIFSHWDIFQGSAHQTRLWSRYHLPSPWQVRVLRTASCWSLLVEIWLSRVLQSFWWLVIWCK